MSRRLSNRRGSISAPDPLGAHANLNHNVQSSSTLTIIRVSEHQQQQPEASSPRRAHRKLPPPDRVSFAFSSFNKDQSTSPSTSPRIRPSSPHRQYQQHHPPSIPRLSPDQLLDLARASTNSKHDNHHPTFTLLPDDVLLPFIDRPAEVASLISTPPSAKLFSLLEKTLATITSPSEDPAKWSFTQLHDHLTLLTRSQAPDVIWVLQARRCIISHSELIWERVKAALGVPPELDVDYDPSAEPFLFGSHELGYASSHDSSVDTDEIPDDLGRSARGHWEDWDAVMDSPVDHRRHSDPESPVVPLSLSSGDDPASLLSIEPILSPSTSPLQLHHHLSISPSNYAATSTHDISGLALDDIQEGAEEEEEQSTTTDTPTEMPDEDGQDPNLISPTHIQGLRISTSPIYLSDISGSVPPSVLAPGSLSVSSSSSSLVGSAYKPPSPISPLPPYNYPTGTAKSPTPGSNPRSRPPSGTFVRPNIPGYGPAGPPPVFRRSGSFGSLGSVRAGLAQEEEGYASSGASDTGSLYDFGSTKLHGHGGPLFVSSFARLNEAPTLATGPS
ncbi:hypothetical protein H0H93_004039 [Arthromyces matolae]|nr:hypothetical protein H0H93_004039 [Arthromyces matolae]